MAKKKAAAPSSDKPAAGKGDRAKFWHDELKAAEKRESTWRKRAQKVVDRYRDEREKSDNYERRTNILWSNTETLKAILFQTVGSPDVRRRFPKKGKDEKVARTAALVLERSLAYCGDDYDVDSQIQCVVEDHLLAGRGQAWIVYDADVEEAMPDNPGDKEGYEDSEPEAVAIADQSVKMEHVYWEDYRTSAGRKESDIWWKARKHQYALDELKTYFPDDADQIPLDATVLDAQNSDKEQDETFKRSNVWEIWDKRKKERLYVAEGYPVILKRDEDPYKLREFFPCPPALYGCKTTSSLVPIPEYTLYQDQCEELDAITTRLNRLIDALKRRGVYDATIEGADNQLSSLASAGDNEFVPYRGMAQLMEKGGLKNVFQSEDLAPIITVVQGLYEQRAQLIQTIYEVTGISDVIRGQSNPNETATAQRIKGQFGSLRVTTRQQRVAKFIRDAYRIKAEIVAEHFTREKLSEMTGIDLPMQAEIDQANQQLQMAAMAQQQAQQPPTQAPPGAPAPQQPAPGGSPSPMAPPMPQIPPDALAEMQAIVKAASWEDVSGILRSDSRRGYKVDIETDDTAQMDEQQEKESRQEFMTAMTTMMTELLPGVQQFPALAPLAHEMANFYVRAFKAGRPLEDAFDDAFSELEKMAAQPKPPMPDPEMAKVQAQQQAEAMKLEFQKQQAQMQAQTEQLRTQSDAQIAAAQTQSQQQIEGAKIASNETIEQTKMAHAVQIKQMEMEHEGRLKAAELEHSKHLEHAKMAHATQLKHTDMGHQMDMQFVKGDQDQQSQAADHEHKAATEATKAAARPVKASNGASPAPAEKAAAAPPQGQMQMLFSKLVEGQDNLARSIAAPQGQMQQLLGQLAQGQQQLMKSNEMLIKAVTAPKTTKLIKDAQGRSIAAVQQTLGFETKGNA